MSSRCGTWMRRTATAVASLSLLGLSGCGKNLPLSSLEPAGPIAEKILNLFNPVFAIAVFVFIVVEGLLVFAIVKFRDRGDGRAPKQVHGNTRMEIGWTLLPAIVLAVISVPTVAVIFDLSREPKNAVQIEVIAHQWWWEYRYPGENVSTANIMHIPAGRPVYLSMRSGEAAAVAPEMAPSGVIHSFWVPRLAGKQDVVPGHTNHLIIEASEPGEYKGQCVEFCGLSHANMRLRVIAQPAAEYEQWLRDQAKPAAEPSDGLAVQGKRVFSEGACVGCHTINGVSKGVGAPDLTHFASRPTLAGGILDNNAASVEEWLRNPPAVKPGSWMPNLNLSKDQIDALVAYLGTLK